MDRIRDLSQHDGFRECVLLTDRAIEEQYDMDLVLRFLLFRTMPEKISGNRRMLMTSFQIK